MKKYLIYKFTSPSGKSYIGQTCDLKRRLIQHKYSKICIAFARAREKYGFDNFICEILEENLTLEEANIFEELYIAEHNTMAPNGYNLYAGGNNHKCSEETKKKISGENNPSFGKTGELSPHYGKHRTTEVKQKLREANIGENSPNYGKFGENNPCSKKYLITFPDGHQEIIIGLREFCRNKNLNQSNMVQSAKGNIKYSHHKGFKCCYYTED